MKVKLMEKIKETENTYSLVFEPENILSWKPGQFIFYKIPHKNPDNRGIERHFTISSAPFERNIRLTTKFDLANGSSFKKALLGLQVGENIEAYNLGGDFTVDSKGSGLVFIAGGIGITPFRSILVDLERKNNIKDIIMFYSCRDKQNIVFRKLWKELEHNNEGLKIYYIFEPQLINKELISRNVSDLDNRKFYVSGPLKMVEAVKKTLVGLNISKEKIIKDYFPGYE